MSSILETSSVTRILDAAIDLFGQRGFAHTTIRQIAAQAGVAVGLINHHFGSKDALREACDRRVIETVGQEKELVAASGSGKLAQFMSAHPQWEPLITYVMRSFREGGPVAEHLFAELVAATKQILITGERSGVLAPQSDLNGAATLLTAYGVGVTMLGDLVARQLGGARLAEPEVYERYAKVGAELFTRPLFLDAHLFDDLMPDAPTAPPPASDRTDATTLPTTGSKEAS